MKFIILLALVSVSLQAEIVISTDKTDNVDAAYGADASDSDLVNTGAESLAGTLLSPTPSFGSTSHNNGVVGAANNNLYITYWSNSVVGSSYSITYDLNTSVNTFGYDITSLQTIHGWTNNSGYQKNQNYRVFVSTVGDPGFTSIATVAYNPYTGADTTASTKVNVTENVTGILATGVDAIRFVFTVPSSASGSNPSPTIREIDVFGAASPNTTVVTAPITRHVVQRDASNVGSIPVSGSVGSPADRVEARAVVPSYNKDFGAIWFVGDSITQSNLDGDPNGSPRKSLYDLLVADGVSFSFTGHYRADVDGLPATGATTATNLYQYHSGVSGSCIGLNSKSRTNMTANIAGWWNSGRLAPTRPNIVLIMLGTNDIDLNDNVADAPNRIKTLVDTILSQVGPSDPVPAIFVAQIPPNTGSAAKLQRVIDFNNALPAVITTLRGEGKDVSLVDQFTPINANTAGLMQSDTLHLNSAGNAVLASQWFNAIKTRFAIIGRATTTPWKTIATNPTGAYSGDLTGVSAGGWYNVEIRTIVNGFPIGTVTVPKVGVGDIYVTAGESNSANEGSPPATPVDDRVVARSSVTVNTWVPAADPLPIATGVGGSTWSRLGNLLADAEDIPIGFVAIGVDGTQASDWLPGTPNYDNRLKLALQSFPVGGFRGVLWHQGESDSVAGVSAADHANRLNAIITSSRIDAGWSVPWYLAEASFHPNTSLVDEERVAAGERAVVNAGSPHFSRSKHRRISHRRCIGRQVV